MNYRKNLGNPKNCGHLGRYSGANSLEIRTLLSENAMHHSHQVRDSIGRLVEFGRGSKSIARQRRVLKAALRRIYDHEDNVAAKENWRESQKGQGNNKSEGNKVKEREKPLVIDFTPAPSIVAPRLDLAPHGTVVWHGSIDGSHRLEIKVFNPLSAVNGGDFEVVIDGEAKKEPYANYQLACNAVRDWAEAQRKPKKKTNGPADADSEVPAWMKPYLGLPPEHRPNLDPEEVGNGTMIKTLPNGMSIQAYDCGFERFFKVISDEGYALEGTQDTYHAALKVALRGEVPLADGGDLQQGPDWMSLYRHLAPEDRSNRDPDTARLWDTVKSLYTSRGGRVEIKVEGIIGTRTLSVRLNSVQQGPIYFSYKKAIEKAREIIKVEDNRPEGGGGVTEEWMLM